LKAPIYAGIKNLEIAQKKVWKNTAGHMSVGNTN
jgi:hypothetical protein